MEKAAVPAVDLAKQHGPYYYAHAAKAWEVPEDAKTISGEGLTHTGQGPRRLDGAAATAGDAPDDASMEGLRQEVARLRARATPPSYYYYRNFRRTPPPRPRPAASPPR